jgi:hypothetical protein
VHAARPAQQQISSHRPVRMRIIVPFRRTAGPTAPQRRQRADPRRAQRRVRAGQQADDAADQRGGQGRV